MNRGCSKQGQLMGWGDNRGFGSLLLVLVLIGVGVIGGTIVMFARTSNSQRLTDRALAKQRAEQMSQSAIFATRVLVMNGIIGADETNTAVMTSRGVGGPTADCTAAEAPSSEAVLTRSYTTENWRFIAKTDTEAPRLTFSFCDGRRLNPANNTCTGTMSTSTVAFESIDAVNHKFTIRASTPAAGLGSNVETVAAIDYPAVLPAAGGKSSCMIYVVRRGPGAGSRWSFPVNAGNPHHPFYNRWNVFIPAGATQSVAANTAFGATFLHWSYDFRYEEPGWKTYAGYLPPSVVGGHWDPCNRCTETAHCDYCPTLRYDMPLTWRNPNDGCTYTLMSGAFPGPGRCGSADCTCLISAIASPLVIDLTGEGITYTADGEHVAFDLGDGYLPTAWIANPESVAFLAMDRNDNGVIDDIHELFGDNTEVSGDGLPENGFEALQDLDSNRDGVIDAKDPAYARLLLWSDRNINGKTDAGETVAIKDAGIATIHLKYQSVIENMDNYGNMTKQRSEVVYADGTTKRIYDVWFAPASHLSLRPGSLDSKKKQK